MPSPASGELLPFGYQVIEITGHSDMWGKYRDLLVCKVCVTLHSSRNFMQVFCDAYLYGMTCKSSRLCTATPHVDVTS